MTAVPVLLVDNLFKNYGSKAALQGVSLKVEEGSVFGLLGPNGAGKTSLVKCVLSLVPYKEGSIFIAGESARNPKSRKQVAFLPERFNFYPFETVTGAIRFYASLHGIAPSVLKTKIGPILERVKLTGQANQKIKTLSKGQLQRVGLSNLLLSDAKLLILDEPFSGLDPIGIRELKDLILELKKEGRSVLLNSHILSEVEQIADEIAILNEGKCLAYGPIEKLKKETNLEDFFFKTLKDDADSRT